MSCYSKMLCYQNEVKESASAHVLFEILLKENPKIPTYHESSFKKWSCMAST